MVGPVALSMSHIYKKFRRGEYHDSLRDLLPALAKRFVGNSRSGAELRTEEFWALRDVSFEVRRGEAVAVIGHNGAGKSTMLKHLTGLIKPTRGTITVNGRLSALIEVGAGFHHDLTGRENIYLNGVILGMSRAEIRAKFDEIVEFSGLSEFIDTPVKRYSSGMFAKLGFSVAAHMEPDILIVDEVLSVGDFMFRAKGLDKMRAVARSGATVVFVSHDIKSVVDLCERSLMLKNGVLIEDGPTSEVMRTYMQQSREGVPDEAAPDVRVVSVVVRAPEGERLDYESGETTDIEVDVAGVGGAARVACVLQVFTEHLWEVFNTSSERLGRPSADIAPHERRTYRFRLDLNLAPGTYHVGVVLYRYDIAKVYHRVQPAATLVITSRFDSGGVVQLNPKLVEA